MMTLQLSPINAVNYQILQSHYEVLDLEHPEHNSDNLNIQFNAGDPIRQEDGADKLEARLEVRTEPSSDAQSGYMLDVAVRGIFTATYSDEGGSADDFKMFMKINAYSLLYTFIRSHVQMLTSMTPSGQVCLPCLDVSSIADVLSREPDGQDAAEE